MHAGDVSERKVTGEDIGHSTQVGQGPQGSAQMQLHPRNGKETFLISDHSISNVSFSKASGSVALPTGVVTGGMKARVSGS